MPYPDNVTAIPELDADDYLADAAGILETAIKYADPIDGLTVETYFAEAESAGPSHDEILLDFTVKLRVLREADPSDAAVQVPLSLGQLFSSIAADMTKAEARRVLGSAGRN